MKAQVPRYPVEREYLPRHDLHCRRHRPCRYHRYCRHRLSSRSRWARRRAGICLRPRPRSIGCSHGAVATRLRSKGDSEARIACVFTADVLHDLAGRSSVAKRCGESLQGRLTERQSSLLNTATPTSSHRSQNHRAHFLPSPTTWTWCATRSALSPRRHRPARRACAPLEW